MALEPCSWVARGAFPILMLLTACSVESAPVAGDPIDSGFYATWATVDMRGAEGDCHRVADVVRITSTNNDTGDVFVDTFDCADDSGTTANITAGDYTEDIDLVDCGGGPCSRGGTVVSGFTVDDIAMFDDGVTYDLGDFEFDAL